MRLVYEGKTRGSRPTSLTTVPRRAQELIPRAARTIVHESTDFMLDMVKRNTPVSDPPVVEGYTHIPGGDGIHLRQEIHSSPLLEAMDTYEQKVGSDKDYAIYVEEGTGLYGPKHAKYLIVPQQPGGWLAWPGHDGAMHFARLVWHPGSPGQHMFLIGAEMTERSMPQLVINGLLVLREGMR